MMLKKIIYLFFLLLLNSWPINTYPKISNIFFPLNFVPDTFLLNYLRFKYKPSKEKCGAAITQKKDRLPDEFLAALICLIDGYRDIYWGYEDEISDLNNIKRILSINGIKTLIYEGRKSPEFLDFKRKNLILYRDNAKVNAFLLKKYNKTCDLEHINHYLLGKLLNYDEHDIQYFYERNKNFYFEPLDFCNDKKEALQWIEQNKHQF